MTAVAGPAPRFDLGKVVERTFTSIGRNFVVFALLSVLLAGIPAAITGVLVAIFASGAASGAPNSDTLAATGGGFGISLLVRAVAAYILQGAITYGAVADLNGRRPSFGECLSTGLRQSGWLFLLAIVVTVSTLFGYLLLIVPGLMLTTAWIVAVPAQVVERTGVFGSLSRSADLTRGNRWPIFGLLVAYAIGSFVLQTTLTGVGAAFAGASLQTVQIVSQGLLIPLSTTATGLVAAVGVASIYYELRSAREGVGPEALAAVFD